VRDGQQEVQPKCIPSDVAEDFAPRSIGPPSRLGRLAGWKNYLGDTCAPAGRQARLCGDQITSTRCSGRRVLRGNVEQNVRRRHLVRLAHSRQSSMHFAFSRQTGIGSHYHPSLRVGVQRRAIGRVHFRGRLDPDLRSQDTDHDESTDFGGNDRGPLAWPAGGFPSVRGGDHRMVRARIAGAMPVRLASEGQGAPASVV